MKKRILATLLSLCMVVGLLPVTALAAEDTQSITYDNAKERTLQGAGTAEDPYLISSADDLERIRYYVKETGIDNTYKGEVPQKYESVVIDGYFKLTADIDLAGSTWVPIGWTEENKDFYAKTAFVGTFDGDHHTIKNLALGNYTSAEGEPTQYFGNGLFTRANGATIKNFTIDGVTTPNGNIGAYASAVVGVLGKGTFENITVKNAEVTVANNFGFIFADSWQYSANDTNDFVVVKNCTVEDSKIHSSAGTVGFIFGRNMNNNADVPLINDIRNCTVKNCTVDAAGGYVGGLWGNLRGGQVLECKAENVTVIQNCEEAKTATSYAGVFGGAITGCTVIDCKASGSVTSNTWNIGGFVGSISGQGSTASNIINCVADAKVEGKTYVGGFAGSASGTFTNCQAKGNVTATQTSTGTTDTDQKLMAGGFVGNLSGDTLTGCSATGNVTATESVPLATGKNARNYRGVGGLVGNANFKATQNIIDCYATGNVSSNLYVGGLVGLPGDSDCLTVKNSYFCGTVTAQDLYGVYYGKNTINNYYRPNLTEGFGYTNGGLFPNGVSHEDGKLATPEKDGYTFGGWYDNEGLTGTAAENYENDKIYYAKWVSEITFDANDGIGSMEPQEIAETDTVTQLTENTFSRDGYEFSGWNTQPDGTGDAYADKATGAGAKGSITLYAQWTKKIGGTTTYTVNAIQDQVYTGLEIKPAVVVKNNGTVLPDGYTVNYFNNTNVGTANATVKIGGDSAEVEFKIVKDENPTVEMADVSVTYGTEYTMSPTAKTSAGNAITNGTITIKYYTDKNCTEEWTGADGETQPSAAGTYYAKATLTGTDNYAEASKIAKIEISKATFSVTATGYSGTYDGQPHAITVMADDDVNVTYSTDDGTNYSETNPTFTNAGTYTVYYKAVKANHEDVTGSVTVEIAKITSNVAISANSTSLTGGGTVKLTVSGVPEDGAVTVIQTDDQNSESKTLDLTGNGEVSVSLSNTTAKYTFTVVYAGDDNHTAKTASCEVSVTRKRSSGGSSSDSSSEKTYSVSAEKSKNGSVKLSDTKAVKGDTVTITVKPEDGYVLDTLTVTDADGDEVKLKDKGDGKFTFTMPDSKITVEATFVLESEVEQPTQPTSHPFADVAAGSWIDTAVQYVYANGLMTGVSETEFAPSAATNRAMIWTILARRSGADTTGGANWYEKGQQWAIANGISDGSNPSGSITREQLAVMLWRTVGCPLGVGDLSAFTDASSISDYAVTAMQWAIETGLMTGNGSGTLAPKAGATRAETAAMFMRFCEANQ